MSSEFNTVTPNSYVPDRPVAMCAKLAPRLHTRANMLRRYLAIRLKPELEAAKAMIPKHHFDLITDILNYPHPIRGRSADREDPESHGAIGAGPFEGVSHLHVSGLPGAQTCDSSQLAILTTTVYSTEQENLWQT